jgi:hypothetical protein
MSKNKKSETAVLEPIETEVSKESFNQLCVWPGTILEEKEIPNFESFFKDIMGVRVKHEATIMTLPSLDENGKEIQETGGRSDVFFYVHADDVLKFALPRLEMNIRWWEDVIKYNDSSKGLYTKEFIDAHPTKW